MLLQRDFPGGPVVESLPSNAGNTGLIPHQGIRWRRKWQPTPVFLPGESQGQGSLVGCCLWGRTELDMTEATQQQQQDMLTSLSGFDKLR